MKPSDVHLIIFNIWIAAGLLNLGAAAPWAFYLMAGLSVVLWALSIAKQ